jgi:8-oxo-dGTP pyrophosphatase MutT (NUDIX family)
MRWTVHGERSVYESVWVNLRLVDVEVPDGPRFDHHVVRMPQPAAGTVVFDPHRGVLLLWRHRFITDTWGWEVPAGRVDEGEQPEEAARRETLEETGWQPLPLRPLVAYRPLPGTCDQEFHLFLADGAEHVGEPLDPSESERVEWVPVERLRREILAGSISDGLTLVGLLHGLSFGPLG